MQMGKLVGSLLLTMLVGTVGCNNTKWTTLAVDPSGKTVRVNLRSVPEHELPVELAWEKLNQELARTNWTCVFIPRPSPHWEVESRIQRMRDEAMKGRAGSSPVNAFNEMVPEIAEALVSKLPAEDNTAKKQVLVVAPVDNRLPAGALETPSLQAALDDFLLKLGQHEAVRQRFVLLSGSDDSGKTVLERIVAGEVFDGNIDPMVPSAPVDRYVPSDIYLIVPRFFQRENIDNGQVIFHLGVDVQRGDMETISEHLRQRASRTYYYHPYQNQWLSQAENDELRRRFFEAVGRK